jgi:hypothetical protein
MKKSVPPKTIKSTFLYGPLAAKKAVMPRFSNATATLPGIEVGGDPGLEPCGSAKRATAIALPMQIHRGRRPFGYRVNEATAVERMTKLRSTGWGFDRIAMLLNDEGIPSRDGKLWHGLVVNRICARLRSASGTLLKLSEPDEPSNG